jgi:hypothetical protein
LFTLALEIIFLVNLFVRQSYCFVTQGIMGSCSWSNALQVHTDE